jgi:hypothetical protein
MTEPIKLHYKTANTLKLLAPLPRPINKLFSYILCQSTLHLYPVTFLLLYNLLLEVQSLPGCTALFSNQCRMIENTAV